MVDTPQTSLNTLKLWDRFCGKCTTWLFLLASLHWCFYMSSVIYTLYNCCIPISNFEMTKLWLIGNLSHFFIGSCLQVEKYHPSTIWYSASLPPSSYVRSIRDLHVFYDARRGSVLLKFDIVNFVIAFFPFWNLNRDCDRVWVPC